MKLFFFIFVVPMFIFAVVFSVKFVIEHVQAVRAHEEFMEQQYRKAVRRARGSR